MRAVSVATGSALATAILVTFVVLIEPHVYVVSTLQAENVCERLANDINDLRGFQAVYVGGAVVEIQSNKIVVNFLGSNEEPISKTGVPSIGGIVVIVCSDGDYAWIED